MIKKLLFVVALYSCALSVSAQYCGNSGSFQCVSSGLSLPWLSPHPDTLPAFVNVQPSTTVIQFKNFNTVYFMGAYYTVNNLRIDTVDNLPPGLCWASNKANNSYANQENGCLKINGVPCGPTGQYKMRIIVTVDLGFGNVQVDADQAGLKYYVRLKNSGDADIPGDSTQTAANAFIPYGGNCGALPLNAYLGSDAEVCNGSVANLSPLVTGGTAPFTYSWNATGNTLSCTTCPNPTATITQNSIFTVTVTDANNATAVDTLAYTVFGAGNGFAITATGVTTFCQGNTVALSGTAGGTFNYQWLKNNANIDAATNLTLNAASTGNYMLLYYNNNCFGTSNIIPVTALPRPNASVTAQPATACPGETITLQAQTDTGITYFRWQFNNVTAANTASTHDVTEAGVYKLIIKNASDCFDTASFNVVYKPLPQVAFTGTPDTLCSNAGSITLTGGSPAGGSYSGPGVSGAAFNPATAGAGAHTLVYSFTDTTTCTNTASQTVVVEICAGLNHYNADPVIAVYPNPANDVAVVESPLINNQTQLQVYDITGKLQPLYYKAVTGKLTVNTAGLPQGMYIVTIHIKDKTVNTKLMKAD